MKRLAHYSQYFLRSPRLIKTLLGHTSIKRTDTGYDIVARRGVITFVLVDYCLRVFAVEVDPRMVQKLHENMAGRDNVTVIAADFLAMPLPKTPYKIFANIPFHLSSLIVRKIAESPNAP